MDEDYRAVRDDLVSRRAAEPDGDIDDERMARGFDVAEAMVRERDEGCERPESGPTREEPNR